jgi:hypothetical protein
MHPAIRRIKWPSWPLAARALFSFRGLHDFWRLYAYGLVHFNEAGHLFPSLPIHASPFVMGFDAAVVHVAVRKGEVEFSSNRP